MGMLFDYFTATSDDEAASVVERDAGPAGGEPPFQVVDGAGIEPIVKMGTLTSLLTGRPYDDIAAEYVDGVVALRDEGERLVVRLPDTVANALADASDERLAEVAEPWSRTDEFAWDRVTAADLTPVLHRLAALARDARAKGQRVYCWVCV